MFKVLFIKEVQESLLDYRSWIVTALCLVLIPLGMFVSRKDYESRLNEHKRDIELYLETSKGNVSAQFRAQGFRPPSELSVFSLGFKDHLPHRVETTWDGYFNIYSKLRNTNLQSVLFGKIDFTFIVINFLSLLAIIFTFSSVSSEKEKGTIKLVLSNNVPRATYIMAKIFGGFTVFLAAFIVSFLVGLLIVQKSESINIFKPEFMQATLLILLFTVLFLFMLFNLGTWISTATGDSTNSIILLLFLWMIITLGIPRVAPMIANIITPVKSEELIQKEIQATKRQLENERNNKGRNLLESMVADRNIHFNDFFGEIYNEEYRPLRDEFDPKSQEINDEYASKISSTVHKITNDHQLEKRNQASLTRNLSRLSPIGSYSFLISELSGTGLSEIDNFFRYSNQFQDRVSKEIYENYIHKRYWYKGYQSEGFHRQEGFDDNNLAIPVIENYKSPTLQTVFKEIWIDMVILILVTIIFNYGAFVSFLRFDVR